MTNELRFDGRVAVITGAGGGLGRAHALLLASRGCKVVVNDLGGSMHGGGGGSSSAADKVVAEIKAAGGEAVPNYDSVEDGDKIVKTALDAWGRIDIVVNNAGILRDTTFHKLTDQDWDLIYRVHVLGGYRVTHAAWGPMRDAGYGRVIFTASAAGIYGNFGQANYSAAKLGLVGLASTLALEGKRRNILVNTIAPIAGSRLTETVMPKDLVDALKPEYVSPLVALLCHEASEETGGLFELGGGFFSKLRWERTAGKTFRLGRPVSIEALKDAWPAVVDFSKTEHPADITASMGPLLKNLGSKSRGGNEFIDVDAALGHEFPPMSSSYTERDLALYALGVGAGNDPLDDKDLRHVYELHADGFSPFPTYPVVAAVNALLDMAKEGKQAPGMNYGFDRILHGEQYLELKAPLPSHAKLTHRSRIKEIWDKGKNALVVTETRSFDESGREIALNEIGMIVRGAGGWGGERGPSAEGGEPERAPDAVIEQRVEPGQALLYRLSGDWNPLHADPTFAKNFGFPRPILHGLCTFGYGARHVLRAFGDGDARRFKSIRARFADSVFPGETLVTRMWKLEGGKVAFTCTVKERDKLAIKGGVIELHTEIPKADTAPPAKTVEAKAADAKPAEQPASSEPGSADIFEGVRFYVEAHPELVGQVGMVFQFKLTNPESTWVIDLKNGKGAVSNAPVAGADVGMELDEADFLGMATGKLNPQKLYFGGKLKVSGNVMAAQKLDFLQKIDQEKVKEAMRARGRLPAGGAPAAAKAEAAPRAPVAAKAPAASKVANAPALLRALGARLAAEPALAADIGAVVRIEVTDPASVFTVDAKASPAVVREGAGAADAVVRVTDEDLVALAKGASAQDLHQRGRLRIDGDARIAHKLGFLKGLA